MTLKSFICLVVHKQCFLVWGHFTFHLVSQCLVSVSSKIHLWTHTKYFYIKLSKFSEHMLKDCTTESVKLLQPEVLKELLPYQQDIPNLWKEVHSTISHFDSNDKDIRCREVFVILMEHFCGYSRSNE